MSSLFKSLFKLQLRNSIKPKEDFLTEIFAHCLKDNRDLLSNFLKAFGIHEGDFNNVKITTQYTLSALENHDSASRPDIAIFLDNRVIFIENKIDSREGYDQLKRYAEHLDQFSLPKTLVYITRDYDPKNDEQILKDCQDNDLLFVQKRWFDIYVLLQKYTSQPIITQLLTFMKELGLSSSKQFSPTDIITLNNFSRVRKMMNETLDGEVAKKFEYLTKIKTSRIAAMSQLRYHDRYIHKADQHSEMWVGLGYFLNSFNGKQYPDLVFRIEVSPGSNMREEVITAFKNIVEKEGSKWIGYGLNDPTSWASVNLQKGLQSVLDGEDHIKNIKSYFLDCLEELRKIRSEYIQLPWRD